MDLQSLKLKANYDFEKYIDRYNDFYLNDFPKLRLYWKTFRGDIDPKILEEFNYLFNEYFNFSAAFEQVTNNNAEDIEYFNFVEYIADLKMSLDIIKNLPKWLKTSLNFIDVFEELFIEYFVRQDDTFESIAKKFYGDQEEFHQIMEYNGLRYNDVNANDWIGRIIKIPARRRITKDVEGILDGLIGENILGKDIKKEFAFVDDDIETVEGHDCFEQSIKLLVTEIPRASIPEYPSLGSGINSIVGKNLGGLDLPIVENELQSLFRLESTLKTSRIDNVTLVDDAIKIDFTFESVLGTTFEEVYLAQN